MVQQQEIFSAELFNKPGMTEDTSAQRAEAITVLREDVNRCLREHCSANASAQVTWLQSSASGKYGSFTQLTAIVSYYN